ncbi:hypothetical protein QAD02_015242 [Eretmocerus hayati]|uniref:Uncharacterized protein n=1 Tax=Eretmocerus hayati TaxID=131215 RepID=A0ACC2PCG9_9HYME|nr:hypothetical protein QAD02_015242 [Eretmocerus hayati]
MIKAIGKRCQNTILNHYRHANHGFLKYDTSGINRLAPPPILYNRCMSMFDTVKDSEDDTDSKTTGRSEAVKLLMKMLCIDRKSAGFIIQEHNVFNSTTKQIMLANYKKLMGAGANNDFILENVILLAQNPPELSKKVDRILKFVDKIPDGLALLSCEDKKIDQVSEINLSMKDHILLIKERFQISTGDMNAIILNYLLRMRSEPQGTLKKIELLLENKVSVDSLIKGEWQLGPSYQKLQERLKKCEEIGIKLKPYIVSCGENVFDRRIESINRRKEYSNQLTHLIQHLSEKSGHSISIIKSRLRSSKLSDGHEKTKLRFDEVYKIIDHILAEGYEYNDIINCLKILSLPRDLIIARFKMLKRVESKISSRAKAPLLDCLTLPDEEFHNYLLSRRNGGFSHKIQS